MNSLSVLSLIVVLSAICAVAADRPQPPSTGSPAPAFTLPNREGAQLSLDQLKGKWVDLCFYPKDFTTGCTIEAHNFQHDIDQYAQIMECNGMTLAARNTFVIDPAGTIRNVYRKVNPQGHSEEVLADLQPLQSAQ